MTKTNASNLWVNIFLYSFVLFCLHELSAFKFWMQARFSCSFKLKYTTHSATAVEIKISIKLVDYFLPIFFLHNYLNTLIIHSIGLEQQ